MKENLFMVNYKTWLEKARDDLNWTNHNLEGKVWYGACFTSQQAVEKALKAYLIFNKKPLRKIHDLRALLKDCVSLDKSFSSFKKYAASLTAYYVETRYAIFEEFQKFSEKQAREAYESAKKIIEFVEKKIKE